METDMEAKGITTKDASLRTGIAEPTIKKYSQALERHGYSFQTVPRGKITQRLFREQDLQYFRKMFALSKKTSMDVDSLAQLVMVDEQRQEEKPIQQPIRSVSVPEKENPSLLEYYLQNFRKEIKSDMDRYENRYNEMWDKLEHLTKIDTIRQEQIDAKNMLRMIIQHAMVIKKENEELKEQQAQVQNTLNKVIQQNQELMKKMNSLENSINKKKWWKFW